MTLRCSVTALPDFKAASHRPRQMLLAILFPRCTSQRAPCAAEKLRAAGDGRTAGSRVVLMVLPNTWLRGLPSSASYRVAWYAVMDGVSSRLSSPLKGGREIACKAPLSVPWLVGFSTLFFSTILLSQEFPIYRHQRQPSTIRFLWTNQIHASTGGF